MRRLLLGALAALSFAGLTLAQPAFARPPVWIVRDADSEMLLFGSVHVLPPGLDWRPPALDAALKQADDLWFEIPVDDATEMEVARLASQNGVLPPGKSLFAMVGPRDAQRIMRQADLLGVDKTVLDRLEPWLAEVTLATALAARSGAVGEHGVEATVSAVAPPGVTRRAFETPAEQIAILDGGAPDEQLVSLRETLREMEEEPDAIEHLVKAWMSSDAPAIIKEAYADLAKVSPDLLRRLVTARNANWTKTLDQRLKGKGRTVVIVGVAHLVGPEGVPAKLRALGYSVEGP